MAKTSQSYPVMDRVGRTLKATRTSNPDGSMIVKVSGQDTATESRYWRLLRLEQAALENHMLDQIIWHGDGSCTVPASAHRSNGERVGPAHHVLNYDGQFFCDCEWGLRNFGQACIHIAAIYGCLCIQSETDGIDVRPEALLKLESQVINGAWLWVDLTNRHRG